MNDNNGRNGDPLPRPNFERLDLPDEDHVAFWLLVIREYPPGEEWHRSRKQSRELYHNRQLALEGDYDGST